VREPGLEMEPVLVPELEPVPVPELVLALEPEPVRHKLQQ